MPQAAVRCCDLDRAGRAGQRWLLIANYQTGELAFYRC
jgi:hypothetical protein